MEILQTASQREGAVGSVVVLGHQSVTQPFFPTLQFLYRMIQSKGSVVYIALGTEATPSEAELTELAHGLELSGLTFFWALRKRPGSAETESAELPNGFEERTKGRGLVWKSWVPQLRISAHESVGCFLTHCGWNSIVEGLQQGHPLIMLPMLWDQGLNARALEEEKVGIEMPRDEWDGSFTRNSVAESLRLVMVEAKGRVYRDKAKEMSSIFGDRDLHERHAENFVGYLQSHTSLRKGLQ
ncbi:UDP-glycosyltransferase 91D1-like [Camellia sinensis]|uniref:UDP-glycosyltransferase 91D1-like n=1 Tax=Camellia sinensis TaxID=4442 RepID=UPI001036E62A|nr:UDP-glycosyltransferase 91D1-like [Camellia sinensis]